MPHRYADPSGNSRLVPELMRRFPGHGKFTIDVFAYAERWVAIRCVSRTSAVKGESTNHCLRMSSVQLAEPTVQSSHVFRRFVHNRRTIHQFTD